MKQTTIFELLKQARKLPITQTFQRGGESGPMSVPGIYARNIFEESGSSNETRTFVPYRTLPPVTDYVYGTDIDEAAKLDNSTLQARPIGPVPNQTPVFRGWRPKRPAINIKDLEAPMFMEDTHGPGLESTVPQEREIVNTADWRATAPFPTVPEPMQITSRPESNKGIWMDAKDEVEDEVKNMGNMGDLATDISSIAKDIATSIQAKYGTNPAEIKAAAVAQQQNRIPWGTLATVGLVGAVALYVVPKLVK